MAPDVEKELELRIAGTGDRATAAAIESAIKAFDPQARVRVDPETGIVHAVTGCEALELTEALAKAGFEATAMTG